MMFREAMVRDIEQIQIVRNAVKENVLSNPALVPDKDVEEYITKRGKGWVCVIDDVVAGFSIADLVDHNIWALFVDPAHEGKGIGKQLHNLMLDWYFEQTDETVWLGTAPGTRAETFYRKQGWKEVGVHGKGEVKFEMGKTSWRLSKEINELINYVQSSLYFCNEAFNEIWHITQTPETKEEYDIVSSKPFGFYGVALQYCFIMEYTKLMEEKGTGGSEHVASLSRINKTVYKLLGDSFKNRYSENKVILKQIHKSDLFKKLKDLRNKKFGHADGHQINNPFKIEGFKGEEILEMKSHVQKMLSVFNNVAYVTKNSSFDLHDDNRTANFIRFHAKYKEYYFKNYLKAHEDGYGLNRKVQ